MLFLIKQRYSSDNQPAYTKHLTDFLEEYIPSPSILLPPPSLPLCLILDHTETLTTHASDNVPILNIPHQDDNMTPITADMHVHGNILHSLYSYQILFKMTMIQILFLLQLGLLMIFIFLQIHLDLLQNLIYV